jgi:hypothetical protein
VIADWFWDTNMPLRKTLITIDVEGPRFAVRKVWMQEAGIFPEMPEDQSGKSV